jgi:hypothetical protein
VVQEGECLPSKHYALSLNPSCVPIKKKREREREREKGRKEGRKEEKERKKEKESKPGQQVSETPISTYKLSMVVHNCKPSYSGRHR